MSLTDIKSKNTQQSSKAKFIHVTNGNKTANVNIGPCVSMTQVEETLRGIKVLNLGDQVINGMYSLVNGYQSYEIELLGFVANSHYFIDLKENNVTTLGLLQVPT